LVFLLRFVFFGPLAGSFPGDGEKELIEHIEQTTHERRGTFCSALLFIGSVIAPEFIPSCRNASGEDSLSSDGLDYQDEGDHRCQIGQDGDYDRREGSEGVGRG